MLVSHHFSALINRLVSEKTSLCGRAPEHAPFIFDDFNLCPFPVLSHNNEYDRFSEFYKSF